MKTPITKDNVIKLLVKWGHNEEFVTPIVNREFDAAIKMYEKPTTSLVAKIIMSL